MKPDRVPVSDLRTFIRYDDEIVAPVRLSPRPGWYDGRTASGKPMTRIGTLQGTYLEIYQAKVCENWTARPQKVNCKFRRRTARAASDGRVAPVPAP